MPLLMSDFEPIFGDLDPGLESGRLIQITQFWIKKQPF